MVSRDAPKVSRGDGPPIKRNKINAIFLKAINRYQEKKRGSTDQQKATSLVFAAHKLHDQIKDQIIEARSLLGDALSHSRPATPPVRDGIFLPPAGSDKGEYEKQADAYNDVVDHYRDLQEKFRMAEDRVSDFQSQVKQLSNGHVKVAGKAMGKVEHDIESLENASRDMDAEMSNLALEMGKARDAAT